MLEDFCLKLFIFMDDKLFKIMWRHRQFCWCVMLCSVVNVRPNLILLFCVCKDGKSINYEEAGKFSLQIIYIIFNLLRFHYPTYLKHIMISVILFLLQISYQKVAEFLADIFFNLH